MRQKWRLSPALVVPPICSHKSTPCQRLPTDTCELSPVIWLSLGMVNVWAPGGLLYQVSSIINATRRTRSNCFRRLKFLRTLGLCMSRRMNGVMTFTKLIPPTVAPVEPWPTWILVRSLLVTQITSPPNASLLLWWTSAALLTQKLSETRLPATGRIGTWIDCSHTISFLFFLPLFEIRWVYRLPVYRLSYKKSHF